MASQSEFLRKLYKKFGDFKMQHNRGPNDVEKQYLARRLAEELYEEDGEECTIPNLRRLK